MSIADKLTQIADNQQRVYDAGYENGHAEGYETGYSNGLGNAGGTYENGYNEGYAKGHSDGYDEGNANGYNTGKTDGQQIGYQEGYSAGETDGKTAGRQEQYNEFWDTYQNNGTRTSYANAFYNSFWNDTTYNPKYPIVMGASSNNAFAYSTITDTKVDIIFRGATLQQIFYRCYNLVTVRKIIFEETVTSLANVFRDCDKLTNLAVEGTIKADLNLSYSPLLTHDSIINVINCLGSGTYTLTLGDTNLAKLTDDEKAVATQKGWTLA